MLSLVFGIRELESKFPTPSGWDANKPPPGDGEVARSVKKEVRRPDKRDPGPEKREKFKVKLTGYVFERRSMND